MSNIHKLILRKKETHEQVVKGDIIMPEHNDGKFILTGFSWSSSLASTGRVYVRKAYDAQSMASSYFPSVFGLEIVMQHKETGEISQLWQL
jgi:hypothetical protein